MNLFRIHESMSLAFGTLRSHKFRSFLTMLGIILGVASLLSMFSLTAGIAHGMRESDAHAGGPAVEHFLEDALVLGHSAHLLGFVERRFRHGKPRCLVHRLSA